MKAIHLALVAVFAAAPVSLSLAQAPNHPRGADGPPAAADQRRPLPAPATTRHTLTLADRTLTFDATAGALRLFDAESGAPRADLAYIAYTKPDTDPATRPVVFIFNGGPGYASGWLQLGGLGPWRLPMSGDAARPSASPTLLDNADTWLDFADLVFIDPPGTGYGRIFGGEDVRKAFWSVNGDVGALATFIRRWVEANNRGRSPKFMAGESYGGFRAPKIAAMLQNDQGVGIDGLILISPALDFARLNAHESDVLAIAARLPSMAAVARARQGPITRATMTDVEDYAASSYLADLLKGPNDAEAVARVSAKVAALTGLDRDLVAKLGGRVPLAVFAREANRADKRVSSLYDGEATGLDPTPFAANDETQDQLRIGLHAPIVEAMVELYRNRLKWTVEDGRYAFLNEQAGRQWDYGRRPPESASDLGEILALDPRLRVLIAHGLTDLTTPYYSTKMTLDQVPVAGRPARLTLRVYPGGHMVYIRDDARAMLRADAAALIGDKDIVSPP